MTADARGVRREVTTMASAFKKIIVGAVTGAAVGLAVDVIGQVLSSSARVQATKGASKVVSHVRESVTDKAARGRIMLEGKDLSEVVRQAEAAASERLQGAATEHKSLNGALRGGVNLLAHLIASLAEPSR